jgi:hypothetical protein
MYTRTGKIARLPEDIRLELNRRIMDGESGPNLLAWLNRLPSVRDVLAQKFGGRPINLPNLSAWRTGGYREWNFRREILQAGIELHARCTCRAGTDKPLTNQMTGPIKVN